MTAPKFVEPWMTGSHEDVHPLLRPLLHCFEHANLDLGHWTHGFTPQQMWERPMDLGAVGFHIRHIAGSAERLFTYAQGEMLTDAQLDALRHEADAGATREELLAHLDATLDRIAVAVRQLDAASLTEPRTVGRKRLPTTLAGLLVHIAEHTQRHVGEAIVTAKVVRATAL